MPLTDLKIRNSKPRSKPYKLFDGEGLYILVNPSGSKLWIWKYYFLRSEKTLSIGPYPVVSVSAAREKRFAAKKLLLDNIDPSTKKREDKQQAIALAANTFKLVATDWHDQNKSDWTPDHAARILRRLELYAFPSFGNKPVSILKTPDIIVPLKKLSKEGKIETAHRLARSIHAVFRHSIHEGLREDNPADHLDGVLKAAEKKHFPTIKSEELPEFFKKLHAIDTTRQNKIAVLLLMLTFLRTGELRKSKPSYLDMDAKTWTIPVELMKTRRTEHIVPLNTQSIALLTELRKMIGNSEYLFPSQQRRKNSYMSENTVNHVLHRMGYKGKLVGHGFRSLASTTLNEESGFNKDAIEVQLSHMDSDKIRAIYNRAEYLQQRAQMMQWWGDYLEQAAKACPGLFHPC